MNHLLVVDDSTVDCRLVGGLLERHTEYHVEYASNGLEAIELLEARLPLAVVTDLQMPEMDGMQLVEAIRHQFPTVPVILMTAHGSEEIALRALMLGAADYVPKAKISSDLLKSVKGVLAIAVGPRPHKRLSHCLQYEELQYALENDVLLIPPLVEQLQQVALDLALVDEADGVRLAKALVETLRNAIYHGNLELADDHIEKAEQSSPPVSDIVAGRRERPPYRDRKVQVSAVFSPREARFVIQDEGPGFNTGRLPDVHADPSYLSRGGGRGLVLINMFMDKVAFNSVGNEITLVKHAAAGGCASAPT
jgi:CheY-like chemotaxis protein/anti-sigma regulatory factor (Ser/Thr protein kinase)